MLSNCTNKLCVSLNQYLLSATLFLNMEIQKLINRLTVILAISFWPGHSYFNSLVSTEGISFLQSCFNPSTENLLIRGFVILLLMIFFAYAARLINVINNMAQKLKDHKKDLKSTIHEHEIEMNGHLRMIKDLEKLAQTDPLTSLINRRKFKEMLRYETEKSLRYQSSLALIMCDIDNFKRINDQFGHDTGDHILKIFSKKITDNIRDVDIFTRWGGDEFIILMPNSTAANASTATEHLRKLIEKTDIKDIENFSASFGITEFQANDSIDSFIKRADNALYKAKENGRNRIVVVV